MDRLRARLTGLAQAPGSLEASARSLHLAEPGAQCRAPRGMAAGPWKFIKVSPSFVTAQRSSPADQSRPRGPSGSSALGPGHSRGHPRVQAASTEGTAGGTLGVILAN